MISIIIPVYNQGEKLKNCLDSILNQTYTDFEVIIVNDGSTDETKKIITGYKKIFANRNKQFRYIEQTNQGAPAARNAGWKISQGNYLFFCDADAELTPRALQILYNELEKNPEVSYVYPSHKFGNKLFKSFPFDEEKLKKMPYIHTMALIRRKDFPQKGWDENIKKLQDWDLWLTMLKQGHKGKWINRVLFTVRTGGTISQWVPSFVYKIFPFLPVVKKYKEAVQKIKEKHNL